MKTRWIEGAERRQLMATYAERLWSGRENADVKPGLVRFDGCRYYPRHSDPNEFSDGSSRLVDGETEFMMAWSSDPLSVAVDAIVAWKILQRIGRSIPVLPESIEVPGATPAEPARPTFRQMLRRIFDMDAPPQPLPSTTIVLCDPADIARHELGRVVHDLIEQSGDHPVWGRVDLPLLRGIELDVRDMIIHSHDFGDTRVHPSWRQRIRSAVTANEQGDPKWLARDAHARRDSTSELEFL